MIGKITASFTTAWWSRILVVNQYIRGLKSVRMSSTYWSVEEISIPHPHGTISVRAWGKKGNHPVLALHGWLDNAGTFNKLIPLLTPSLYIVAVDAPGHGLSFHKPQGFYYSLLESLSDLQRVVKFLKWDRFSILGHSAGGATALVYASVFPEQVENIISLDSVKYFSRSSDRLPGLTKATIENLLEMESKGNKPPKVYTLEEARKRLMEALYNEITPESADIILQRGAKKSDCGTGVVFTRDYRLQLLGYSTLFSHDMLKAYMSKLSCNLLIISAADTIYKSTSPEVVDEFLETYEKHCKSFMRIMVSGTHYVHLNQPHVIAPYINHFFNTHLSEMKSKL